MGRDSWKCEEVLRGGDEVDSVLRLVIMTWEGYELEKYIVTQSLIPH